MMLKKQIYLTSAIFGIIILVPVLFSIYFFFTGIQKKSRELIEAKRNAIVFEADIKEVESFGEIYKGYQPNLEKINQLFIDPKAPIDFIQFLETTASSMGIFLEISPQILPASEKEGDFWPSIGFKISSTGSFLSSIGFLEKLESSPYLVVIQNFNLERLSQDRVKTNFSIKVFTK